MRRMLLVAIAAALVAATTVAAGGGNRAQAVDTPSERERRHGLEPGRAERDLGRPVAGRLRGAERARPRDDVRRGRRGRGRIRAVRGLDSPLGPDLRRGRCGGCRPRRARRSRAGAGPDRRVGVHRIPRRHPRRSEEDERDSPRSCNRRRLHRATVRRRLRQRRAVGPADPRPGRLRAHSPGKHARRRQAQADSAPVVRQPLALPGERPGCTDELRLHEGLQRREGPRADRQRLADGRADGDRALLVRADDGPVQPNASGTSRSTRGSTRSRARG